MNPDKKNLFDALRMTAKGQLVWLYGGRITYDDVKRAMRLFAIRPGYLSELGKYRATKDTVTTLKGCP